MFLNSRFEGQQDITVADFKEIPDNSKSFRSICLDVSDAIIKKHKVLVRKDSLFDQNKTYNLTLKYHEAKALLECLIDLDETEENDYYKMLSRKLRNQLHEKLTNK